MSSAAGKPTVLKPLVRSVTPAHAKDVARMRRVLNVNGFDADPVDIESAYVSWSAALPHHPAWHHPGHLNDAMILDALTKGLVPAPEIEPEPAPATPLAKDPNHDAPPAKQDDARAVELEATAPAAPERPAREMPGVRSGRADDRGGRRDRR